MAGERVHDNGGRRRMAETGYTLVIGDKNFSSWSLRPWLAMKAAGIPFAEEHVRLRQPETKQAILRHSPSGKVPALKAGGEVIWDGLAILEFLAERHSEKRLWPEDPAARAAARSISAEMHAGFATLRNEMPMDLLARLPSPHIGDALASEIRRIIAIWRRRAHASAPVGRTYSEPSPMPTRCLRRSPHASVLMRSTLPRSATTARLRPMPMRS